jgi:hypothetical protein
VTGSTITHLCHKKSHTAIYNFRSPNYGTSFIPTSQDLTSYSLQETRKHDAGMASNITPFVLNFVKIGHLAQMLKGGDTITYKEHDHFMSQFFYLRNESGLITRQCEFPLTIFIACLSACLIPLWDIHSFTFQSWFYTCNAITFDRKVRGIVRDALRSHKRCGTSIRGLSSPPEINNTTTMFAESSHFTLHESSIPTFLNGRWIGQITW